MHFFSPVRLKLYVSILLLTLSPPTSCRCFCEEEFPSFSLTQNLENYRNCLFHSVKHSLSRWLQTLTLVLFGFPVRLEQC